MVQRNYHYDSSHSCDHHYHQGVHAPRQDVAAPLITSMLADFLLSLNSVTTAIRAFFIFSINRLTAQIIQRFRIQNVPLLRHATSASLAAATFAA